MQKLMKAIHQNEKGFTLVELMVVVVIIGILIAIAIPLYNTVQATAREKACFANQRTIDGSIAMYRAEGGTEALTSANQLAGELDGPAGANTLGPYLMAEPRCPLDSGPGGAAYGITDDAVDGCPVTAPLVPHGHYGGGS